MTAPHLTRAEEIPEAFARAWNAGDADGIAALFDEDAEFVNVTGLWWHDREAIRRAHAYGLSRIFPGSRLRVLRTEVKLLADTIAVVHARIRLEGQAPIGDVTHPQPRTTIFSFVVHQTAAGWSCASAHNTDVSPNMETHVIDESGRLRPVDYRSQNEGSDPASPKPR